MSRLILFSCLVIFSSTLAHATLGERESSIETDRVKFSAVRRASQVNSLYSIHEITDENISIREYVAQGIVFAVAWNGIHHPDLENLLGHYWNDYQISSNNMPKIRGMRAHRRIQGQHVVVEMGGHMRALQGKAYDPTLMPVGVTPNEIK